MTAPDGCVLGSATTGSQSGTTQSSTTGIATTGYPGYDYLVTVGLKTPSNPQYFNGFNYGYFLNGIEDPVIPLTRGIQYLFKVSAGCNHRVYISSSEIGDGLSYIDDGVQNNDACSGDILYFTPDNSHPDILYYQCAIHDSMGWILNISGIIIPSTTESPFTTGAITSGLPFTTGAATTASLTTKGVVTSGAVTSASLTSALITSGKLTSGSKGVVTSGAVTSASITSGVVTTNQNMGHVSYGLKLELTLWIYLLVVMWLG